MTNTKIDAAALRKIARRLTTEFSVTSQWDGSVGVCTWGSDSVAIAEVAEVRAAAVAMGLVILGGGEVGFNACRPGQEATIRARRFAAERPIWRG